MSGYAPDTRPAARQILGSLGLDDCRWVANGKVDDIHVLQLAVVADSTPFVIIEVAREIAAGVPETSYAVARRTGEACCWCGRGGRSGDCFKGPVPAPPLSRRRPHRRRRPRLHRRDG